MKLLAAATFASTLALAGTATAGATPNTIPPVGHHGYSDPNTPSSITITPDSATVSGTGVAPDIECAWILPDLNGSGGSESSYTSSAAVNYEGAAYTNGVVGGGGATPPTTMTYGVDSAQGTLVSPGGTGAIPCDVAPTAGGNVPPSTSVFSSQGAPSQATGWGDMINLLPNANNSPALRRAELWAAVDDATGLNSIGDVYFDVFYPNGQLYEEVYGVPIEGSGNSGCTGPTGMFAAASGLGELSANAVTGIQSLCQEGVKSLWHQTILISKDMPNGAYMVTTHAVQAGSGAPSSLSYSFNVLPFYDLAIDFSGVNFGQITPGSDKILAGDTSMSTPSAPTVQNEGNSGMDVGVSYSVMTGTTYGKTIGQLNGSCVDPGATPPPALVNGAPGPCYGNGGFDANFGLTASTIEVSPEFPSGFTFWFDPSTGGGGKQNVCPNDTSKLDLSVDPPTGIPADTYTGTVTITAKAWPGPAGTQCSTDNGAAQPKVNPDTPGSNPGVNGWYYPNSGVRV